jgi:uncharacterized membrane protein YdjX (TVP38/TMEM64 family)
VTALAYELARLIGPLHVPFSAGRAVGKRTPSSKNHQNPISLGPALDFARLIREGLWPVNATGCHKASVGHTHGRPCAANVKKPHNPVSPARARQGLVYKVSMSARLPPDQPRGLGRRLLLLAAIILLAGAAFFAMGGGTISLESLVRYRSMIDRFVADHRMLSVLAYIGLYVVTVALSVPGAALLTVVGGFLFGIAIGASAAVIGATIGATLIFLVARTALGEPLLRWAGPRANQLAERFRADAFSYLLFLRLVPAFPFFLVNLVAAFAGVRLGPFVAATALGIIPAAVVYALAGIGLDSVIAAQENSYRQCVAAQVSDCHMVFDPMDVLTPQMITAFIAIGLLALMPVALKYWRARSHAAL